ncbi:DUF5681 domain-containing protein [Methylobacterium sp. CM6257]
MTTGEPGFQPGRSGNPAGRPKGARHRTTLAMEALLDGESEALTRKASRWRWTVTARPCGCASTGLCPPRRDRHVPFALPPITDPNTMVRARSRAVIEAFWRADR